jgi:hypothetical protein
MKALNYIEHNCKNPTLMHEMDTDEECHKRTKIAENDPSIYAIGDVLEHWWICGKDSCEKKIESMSGFIKTLIYGLLIIFGLFIFMWSIYLRSVPQPQYSLVDVNSWRGSLPHFANNLSDKKAL